MTNSEIRRCAESMIRPVRCWFCNQRMYYAGHRRHAPEVHVDVNGPMSDRSDFYAHLVCWKKAMERKAKR